MDQASEKPFKVLSTQPTPNPDALKFLLSQPVVLSGAKSFASEDEAEGDVFAEALFELPGVQNIYLNQDYVSVTKSMMEDWTDLVEPIRDVIENKLACYKSGDKVSSTERLTPQFSVTPEEFEQCDNDQKRIIVEALLDETVRPALAADGGGLMVQSVENHIIRIHYQGACGSCPSSTQGTLRAIEGILQKSLGPEVRVHTAIL